jgi:nickel/cobalt exporter
MSLTLALVAAAAGIGSLHACAPDHWVPFAALSRARQWRAPRTAAVTAACGFAHVTASVLLALLAMVFGREIMEAFGRQLEGLAGLLLIGFGVAYAAWGVRNAIASCLHRHAHAHGVPHHHHPWAASVSHEPSAISQITPWTLVLLFAADPCVAVIPLMFASAPLGWVSTAAVVLAYQAATIGTMVLLVLPARAVAVTVRSQWADRYGDALAGGVIALVGVAVVSFGV